MTRLMVLNAAGLAMMQGLLAYSGSAQADEADIFSNDHYSVICIISTGIRYNGKIDIERGTGFFLTSDGIAVTNNHVALDSKDYKEVHIVGVVRKGVVRPVIDTDVNLTVLERDAANDLAVLRSDKPAPSQYVHVGGKSPVPGNALTAIGCPEGEGPSLRTARISNMVDEARGRWLAEGFIVPGFSGGPVFNTLGRVIGIATAGIPEKIVDGKKVQITYPAHIITPFEMAENIVLRQNVTISRGDETGTSPPLVLTQKALFRDKFMGGSWGSFGGTYMRVLGTGHTNAQSIPGTEEKGDAAEFWIPSKPKPKPVLGKMEFNAVQGYEFQDASIQGKLGDNFRIQGTPVISTDKKKLTVTYATDASTPNIAPNLSAIVQWTQMKVNAKPAQLQKVFDLYETNESPSSTSEKTVTYHSENGYRFSAYRFQRLAGTGASQPRLQLLDNDRKLEISFTLDKNGTPGLTKSGLSGFLFTSQTLNPNQ